VSLLRENPIAWCCARTNDGREYLGRSGGIDSGTEQRVNRGWQARGLNRPQEVSALVRPFKSFLLTGALTSNADLNLRWS